MWKFKSFSVLLFLCCAVLVASKCPKSPQGTAKLVCYYEGRRAVEDVDPCACTHLVYTGAARGDELADISRKLLEKRPKLKFLLRINGKDKEIAELIKSSTIHGIDIHEAHNAFNRTRITKSTESLRTLIGSDAILMMSIPAQSELLAKYYDLKSLVKPVSMFSVETHHLGEVKNATYHPSRLSGMWDMMNTDSIVDLVIGLGLPAAKIIVTSPANAFKFTLMNNTLSTPGSPTTEEKPIGLNRKELCVELNNGEKWTLERDQDLTAPYAFKDEKWLAFEDTTSLDVKGKYTRIRGLAGMGLLSIDDDAETECGNSLLQSIHKSLGFQSRAPRGAVLSSLENEILSVPHSSRLIDSVQVSPYRISSVVDADGVIHSIREDTRTEFECQRQGYFVHPRSCNRFYRCVKFNQLSDEFTVFEFDCPAGLAFDARYEVCVWPGSLSHGQACPGSSEIAPVPQTRFICPEKPGYYADPANCRWFFACLDHGKSPLSAYEFRCPFGLGFDESKLICDWPWLVPRCGNVGKYESTAYGHGSSVLTGASSYIGLSADSVNVAAHQSLISGASTDNLIGIQSGFGYHQNGAYQGNGAAQSEYQYEGNHNYNGDGYNQYDSGKYSGDNNGFGQQSILSGSAAHIADSSNINQASGISSFAGGAHGNNYNGQSSGIYTSGAHGNNYNGQSSGKYASGVQGNNYNGQSSGQYNSGAEGNNYNGQSSGKYTSGAEGNNYNGQSSGKYTSGAEGNNYNGQSSGKYTSGAEGNNYNGQSSGKYTSGAEGNNYNGQSSGKYTSSAEGNNYNGQSSGKYTSGAEGNNYNGQSSGKYTSGAEGNNYNGQSSSKYTSGSSGIYSGAYNRYPNQNGHINNHQSSSFSNGNGQYYNDYNGEYRHDDSGEYKHDNSGDYYESSLPYVHVDSGNVKYTHSNGGVNSNSQYKQSSFGYNGNQGFGLSNQVNSGLYSGDNAYNNYGGVGIYQSGADYGKYAHGQSYANSSLFNGNYNNQNGNNLYVDHAAFDSSAPKTSSFYNGAGVNAYSGFTSTGGAHVLTAGAINSGLVGKTTLIDTTHNKYDNGKYSGNFGSTYSNQYQAVNAPTISGNRHEFSSSGNLKYDNQIYGISQPHNVQINHEYTAQPQIPIKYVQTNSNAYSGNEYAGNNYAYLQQSTIKPVTSGPIETYVKPKIFVTPRPEIYNAHSTIQPSAQIHTIHSTESNYKPYVSSTTTQAPIYKHTQVEIERQPLVAITNYNSPSVPVQQTYHKQYESVSIANPSVVSITDAPSVSHYPSYVSSTYKTPIIPLKTEYKNPLIHFNNVTPRPTIASVSKFVQQPSYSTYISQPTVSTFQNTGNYEHSGSYNAAQQNTAFHTQHSQQNIIHEQPIKYQQPIIAQKVVQPVKIADTFVHYSPTPQTYVKQPYASHQSYQHVNIAHNNENQYVSVSSTPKPIVFESKVNIPYTYEAPEYLPPKIQYSTPAPIMQQVKFVQPKPIIQQKYVQPVSIPDTYVHVSSTPQTIVKQPYTSYQQVNIAHVDNNKYVKPVYSTPKPVIFESNVKSQTYTYKSPEYLPPKIQLSTLAPIVQHVQYQPSAYKSNHGVSSSSSHFQQAHVDQIDYSYKAPEYVSQVYSSTSAPIKYQQSTIHHSYDAPKTVIFPTVQVKQEPIKVSYENVQINNPPQYIAPVIRPIQPVVVSSTPAIVHFEKTFNYQLPKVQTFQSNQYSNIKYDNGPKVQISTPAPFAYQSYSGVNTDHASQSFHISSNSAENSFGVSSSQASINHPQDYIKINTYQAPTTHQTYQSSTFLPKAEINTAAKYQTYQSSTYLPPKVNVFESKFIQTKPVIAYRPSTEAPVVVSTFKGPDYLPPVKTKIAYKQPEYIAKYETVTQSSYKPYSSTIAVPTYEVPINPIEEFEFKKISVVNPPPVVYKKPAVVIQQKYVPKTEYTSNVAYEKSNYNTYTDDSQVNLLGFGTVGPDAGLVRPTASSNINVQKISTYAPLISSTYAPSISSTYAPVPQRYIEVTPPTIKKIRPKVAVVTKVNDFNPLLVRKLGAVCSCRSNVLQLRKPKPDYTVEYETEYDDASINNANDDEWTYKSSSISPPSLNYAIPTTYSPIKSTSPVVIKKPKVTLVSSTINPIIVQDFNEEIDYAPVKSTLQPIIVAENYDRTNNGDSTVHFVSNVQQPTRGRPLNVKTRVRPVTIAPTLASVLIPEYQSQSLQAIGETRPFDRYGPGGLRSRDETLQGSIDCQRVGLFRHPKHCNKFYSCRWDCTKKRFTLHVFNCPVQLSFDPNMGACNWPSQGPACQDDTLLP